MGGQTPRAQGTASGVSRGFTLTEAVVAMAIAALAAIALMPLLNASARAGSRANDPLHTALNVYAVSLARDAAQAWKYGAPGGLATLSYSASMYGGAATPTPVTVTQTVASIDTVSAQVTVTVSAANDSASASSIVAALAPLPGSQLARPGLVPMPTPSTTP